MDNPFQAYTGDEPYVFVCYAHDDSEIIFPEIDWLRQQGTKLWYDEGIPAGKNWRASIGDSLLGASHVLFYISRHSLKSEHCNREINLALDEDMEVVPIYLEEIELTSDLKVGLNRVQALHRDQDGSYQQHLINALGQSTSIVESRGIIKTKDSGKGLPLRQSLNKGIDRKLFYATFALLVLAVGFLLGDRFLVDQSGASLAGNQASSSSGSNSRVVRSALSLGDLVLIQEYGYRSVISLSADGSRFAYTSSNGTSHQIYIRDLDQLEPRPLGPPINTSTPGLIAELSPDGEWVFFKSQDNLYKISVDGGPAQFVTDGLGPSIYAWGTDDTFYFTDVDSILRQVPTSGGESQSLGIPVMADMNRQFTPHILPKEKALLFTRSNLAGSNRIELFDLETQDTRILIEAAYLPKYSPTGHITFAREGSLWAVPFDLDNLAISGPEVLLIVGIEGYQLAAGLIYSLSDSGNLIYIPDSQLASETPFQNRVLAWVDRTGAETLLDMVPQQYRYPALSPDGNRIALTIQQDHYGLLNDIWSYDLDRSTLSRVTFSSIVTSSLWSANGDRLFYGSTQGIQSINSTGLGQVEELTNIAASKRYAPLPTTISPDGQKILFSNFSGSEQSGDIHLLNTTPERQSVPLINSEFAELGAVISPDGRWLAYSSNETGRDEVYVRPYPEIDTGKWPISSQGGREPRWAPSSAELFYRNREEGAEDTQTLVVTIETGPDFSAGAPQILFTSDHIHAPGAYSVSVDGQRLLMLKPVTSEAGEQVATPTHAVLVENFDEELKRLVPAYTQ